MVKYLNEPRQLTSKELEIYGRAKTKWLPTLITSFQTPIDQLMASPIKYALLYALFIVFVMSVMLYIYTLFDKHAFSINIYNKYVLLALLVLYLFLFGVKYIKTLKTNDDIILVASYLPEGRIPTRYEFEASPVVQGKLLRSSIGRSGSFGSGLLGGIVGSSIVRRK